MQYRSVLEQGLMVDFASGQALVRVYDSKSDLWYNFASKIDFVPKTPVAITMRDDSPRLSALRSARQAQRLLVLSLISDGIRSLLLTKKAKCPTTECVCYSLTVSPARN